MDKRIGKWLSVDSTCHANLRPEFQNPHKKTSMVAHTCNPSVGDGEMKGSLGLGEPLIFQNP